jgi:hypothetical protein
MDATIVDFGCPRVDCQVPAPLCFPAVKHRFILEYEAEKKRLSESAQCQQAIGGIYFTET